MLLVNRRLTDTPEELKDQHEDQEEEENAEDQANRQAGVPTESGSAWLKQKRVRARRALRFLEDKASTFKMLVWMALGTPLQILHFHLFKCGSVGGKDSDGHNALFDCISFPRSMPLKIMQKIGLSLRPGTAEEAETWGLTTSYFGLPFSWDQAQKKQASTCAWRILGNLYRRFVVRLHAWPWRLAGMVDSRLSNDERAKVAHDYVKANRCCLDPLFGRKFRDACSTEEGGPTVADIMLQPILDFFLAVFTKALASTTHVENMFAHMRRVFNRGAGHIFNVAAYNVLLEAKRVWSGWLGGSKQTGQQQRWTKAKVRRGRPVWANRKKSRRSLRLTSFNLYVREQRADIVRESPRRVLESKKQYNKRILSVCASRWQRLPLAQQKAYVRHRKAEQVKRKAVPDPLTEFVQMKAGVSAVEGTSKPWGLASIEFPIAAPLMTEWDNDHRGKASFVRESSDKWKRERGNIITGDGSIPEKVAVELSCSEMSCSRCIGCMPLSKVQCKDRIVEALGVATTSHGNSYEAEMSIVHCLPKDGRERGILVLCTSHLKSPNYSAEFVLLEAARLGGGHLPGQVLQVAFEEAHGYHLPAFRTEVDVACQLVDELSDEIVAEVALHGIGSAVVLQSAAFHFVNLSSFCIDSWSDVNAARGVAEARRSSIAKKASRSFLKAIRPLPSRKPAKRRRKQGPRASCDHDRRVRRVQGEADPTHLSLELHDAESVVQGSDLDHWSDANESARAQSCKGDSDVVDGDDVVSEDGGGVVDGDDVVSEDSDDIPLSRLVVPAAIGTSRARGAPNPLVPPPPAPPQVEHVRHGWRYIPWHDSGAFRGYFVVQPGHLNGHCHCDGHMEPKCHIDRITTKGHDGSRVVGLVALWLQLQTKVGHKMHTSKAFKRELGTSTYRPDRRAARASLREAGMYERITSWERPKATLDEDLTYIIHMFSPSKAATSVA